MKEKFFSLILVGLFALPIISQANSHTNPLNVDTTNVTSHCVFGDYICFISGNSQAAELIISGGTTGNSVTTPTGGDLSTVQGIMASLAYFLGNVLIPFLFGIALLMFLVNATRYFIIGGAEEASREKAKRLTFYSIAAFVFLVSLWGIVNLFVSSLRINQAQSICPDYLGGYCNNKSYNGSRFTFFNRSALDTRNGATDTRNGTTDTRNGSADSTSGGNQNVDGGSSINDLDSAIGALVYGTYVDTPTLNFNSGAPRALNQVPTVSSQAACTEALQTLQLASDVESNQTAYLLYTDSNGITKWANVTDLTYQNGVAYDADKIADLVNEGAQNLYLLHTHSKDNLTTAGLQSNGYPPSTADMKLMCDSLLRNVTHVIVDSNQVWVLDQTSNSCPRHTDQLAALPVLESILHLSQVTAGDRAQEFTDLLNDQNIPNDIRIALQPLLANSLDQMTIPEIIELSQPFQTKANLDVSYTDVNGFCFSLTR